MHARQILKPTKEARRPPYESYTHARPCLWAFALSAETRVLASLPCVASPNVPACAQGRAIRQRRAEAWRGRGQTAGACREARERVCHRLVPDSAQSSGGRGITGVCVWRAVLLLVATWLWTTSSADTRLRCHREPSAEPSGKPPSTAIGHAALSHAAWPSWRHGGAHLGKQSEREEEEATARAVAATRRHHPPPDGRRGVVTSRAS